MWNINIKTYNILQNIKENFNSVWRVLLKTIKYDLTNREYYQY